MGRRTKKILIRFSIVLFWMTLIGIIFYLPKWKNLSLNERVINVFAWGDILSPALIEEFESETGIHVNLNFYASNEELLVKLRATAGVGYDLIIPSDYAVNILRKEGLLQEIDRSKCPFWPSVSPYLLSHFFDPDNTYSIPFGWEILGLGIDTEYFAGKTPPISWDLIFKEDGYKISMLNDPISVIELAAVYLFGDNEHISQEQKQAVQELLIRQKKWVEAYADFRGDYFLATKNCPVVLSSSAYIFRSMALFDFIGFIVPQEGSFVSIENLCIPTASTKADLTYRLINYLYRPESALHHFQTFGFFPACLNATQAETFSPTVSEYFRAAETQFKTYHFFRSPLPQDQVRDLWVEVKS